MSFRKTTEHTIGARALTDPKPAFVSIVKAGANQVPFRSLKSADGVPEETTMKERIEAMRVQGMEIAKIEFAKGDETFSTVEAVRAWLDDGGYSYAEVTEKDDGFEIENADDTFEEGSIVQVDTGSNGVTVWVGKLDAASAARAAGEGGTEPRGKVVDAEVIEQKTGDDAEAESRTGKSGEAAPEGGATVDPVPEPTAPTEPTEKGEKGEKGEEKPAPAAQKDEHGGEIESMVKAAIDRRSKFFLTDEVRQRFDDFMCHFSEAMTLGGVMADGNDGIPPGFGEGIQAMVVAMRNNLMADNPAGARQAAEDFGDLVVALVSAMESVQDAVERTERCRKAIDLFAKSLPGNREGKPETAGGGLQDAVLRAIADLAKKVDGNQAKTDAAINEVKQDVAGTRKRVEEAEAGLSERVKSLESEKQTRKSADATDENGSTARKKGPIDGLALRSALGISTVSREGGF